MVMYKKIKHDTWLTCVCSFCYSFVTTDTTHIVYNFFIDHLPNLE